MGRKATTISLTAQDRNFLEAQTRARTIQAQTVNRARILLLKRMAGLLMISPIRSESIARVLCFVSTSILKAE